MSLLIAMACAAFLIAVMAVCAFAGTPVQDELNEIHDHQKAD